MASVNLTLNVNVTRSIFQASTSDGTEVSAYPTFTAGDTYDLKIALIEQVGSGPRAVFTVMNAASFSGKVGIGTLGGTPNVLQTSFTASGNYLLGTLDCTTAEFSAAVTAGTPQYLEIEINEGGQYKTVFQRLVTCRKGVIQSGSTAPLPPEEYRTKADSDNTYVKKVGGNGHGITLTSADGLKQVILYCDNDGSFHADAV